MDKKSGPFLILSFLVLSACASQEDMVGVKEDVQKLKTDTEHVKSQSAGSYSDVQQLRDEVARLQGRIEEISHTNVDAFRRLGTEDSLLVHKIDELDSRLQKAEQFLALGPAEKQAVQPAAKPVETVRKPAQEALGDSALFKDGVEKLGQKKYPASRENFGLLLQKYPKSELASNAQFNIGESYFGEKAYEKAILEYQVVIEKYPKSTKIPAALYKQAIAFELIGDQSNAQVRFRDLVKLYPKSPEATIAQKKLK